MKIEGGSDVLFYYNRSKRWLVRLTEGEELHTHIGVIRHSDAIGQEYGSRINTNKDKYVYVLWPTIHDYIMKIRHGTQIIYPKDLGYIAARAGMVGGQKVVEIGTGSGALSCYAAGIVKPDGHVYTFDVSDEFMKIAARNIERAGLSEYVTMQNLDLATCDDPPVTDADLAVVDVGDPWSFLPAVRRMIRGGGGLFAVCPTMNQLERLTAEMKQNEFTDIESTELILRHIEAREGKTRHAFDGIGHTTYLCYARKAFFG